MVPNPTWTVSWKRPFLSAFVAAATGPAAPRVAWTVALARVVPTIFTRPSLSGAPERLAASLAGLVLALLAALGLHGTEDAGVRGLRMRRRKYAEVRPGNDGGKRCGADPQQCQRPGGEELACLECLKSRLLLPLPRGLLRFRDPSPHVMASRVSHGVSSCASQHDRGWGGPRISIRERGPCAADSVRRHDQFAAGMHCERGVGAISLVPENWVFEKMDPLLRFATAPIWPRRQQSLGRPPGGPTDNTVITVYHAHQSRSRNVIQENPSGLRHRSHRRARATLKRWLEGRAHARNYRSSSQSHKSPDSLASGEPEKHPSA